MGRTLLLELGHDYCGYAWLQKEDRSLHGIGIVSFEELEAEAELASLFETLKAGQPGSVAVCSAYAQSMLVPIKLFNEDSSLLEAVFDMPLGLKLNDRVGEWQVITEYALPAGIDRLVRSSFPGASYFHAHTCSLRNFNGFSSSDQIEIHFTTQHFRVLVKKGNALQLAQIYSYKTPLDVVYYLLKLAYEFGLEQSSVLLVVSGLIEKESALYRELHHYFLNIEFAQAPDFGLPVNDYPAYFFTSIYNLASCVS